MQFEVWLPLAICVVIGVSWFHALRLRERAVAHAARLCGRHGLQLLDQSVALHRLTWHWRHGSLQVLREYRFETSLGGHDRQGASLVLLGNRVVRASLPSHEHPASSPPVAGGIVAPSAPHEDDTTDNVVSIDRPRRTLH